MIVKTRKAPEFNELLMFLKSQFSDYAVYSSSSIPQKSIIVKKSGTLGAQISLQHHEILVDACCPNVFLSALIGFSNTVLPPYSKFELQVANFLKKKYG